ncbi:MAG: hypothetical protein EYC69_09770 [Bacteroidetes bacterium]|nr:MAG: hypothetical protein EYC69_09770 [Bacteroidota bacterium]
MTQKINILSVLFILLSSNICFSQISYGPVAGMNISTILHDGIEDFEDISHKIGFHAGIGVDISVSELFKISSGIIYTKKGSRGQIFYYGSNDMKKINYNLNYIPIKFLTQHFV